MKFVSIVFSSLLGILPLQASATTEQSYPKVEWTESSDWVSSVTQDYHAKKYHEFLSDLSKEYQKELQSRSLESDPKLTEKQYDLELQKLQKSRNQQLRRIAHAHSEDPISKTIEMVLQGSEEVVQQKKENEAKEKLMQSSQDPASQEIYNVLEEHRIKKLLLAKRGILNSKIYTKNTGLDELILALATQDKLLMICDKYPNSALAEHYRSIALSYPKQASYQKDEKHLQALALGGVKAHTTAEKKVAKVMKNTETEKQKLAEKFLSK